MIGDSLYQRLVNGERGAFDELVSIAVQEALKALPSVVKRLTSEATVLQTSAKKFYDDNPDLVNHKQLVQKLIEREEGANPGIAFDKLLVQVLPKIRERIALKASLKETSPFKPELSEMDLRFKGLKNA